MELFNGLRRKFGESHLAREGAEVYRYYRLSTEAGTSCIRLFELEDASNDDVLRGHLVEVDLAATPKPSYDAISYSWRRDILHGHVHRVGSAFWPDRFTQSQVENATSALSRPILCDGKLLRIQPNLYDFLIRLRHLKRHRPLWIDALCIDQDESDVAAKEEKMRQLQIMGKIYESADTVLVWLGESKHVSSSFPKYLENLHDNMSSHQYEPYLSEHDVLKKLDQPSPLNFIYGAAGLRSDSSWRRAAAEVYRRLRPANSLLGVMGRDYFQRAWVVQEIALAKELVFFVGPMQIPATSMLNGVQLLDNLAAGGTNFAAISMPYKPHGSGFGALPHLLKSREDRLAGKNWRFEDFLFLCRDREATRPEDKVFSLLGLADEELRESLQHSASQGADPRAALHSLYVRCAVIVAQRRGWPYVLQLVGKSADATKTAITGATGGAGVGVYLEAEDNKNEKDSQLPSWTPDLRIPLLPKPFWFYGCTHYRGATTVKPAVFNVEKEANRWTLTLYAAQVDTVEQVGESFDELGLFSLGSVEGHMLDLVSKLGYEYEPKKRMGCRELSMDAFLRSITGDVFKRRPIVLDRVGEPTRKLRKLFRSWVETNFSENEELSSGYTGRIVEKAELPMKRAYGNTNTLSLSAADINGSHLAILDTRKAFLEVHDSDTYPMAEDFGESSSNYRDKDPEERPGRGAADELRTAVRPTRFFLRRRDSLGSGRVPRKQKWLKEFESGRMEKGKDESNTSSEEKIKDGYQRTSSVPPYLPSMHMHRRLTYRTKPFRHVAGVNFPDEIDDSNSFDSDDGFNIASLLKFTSKDRDIITAFGSIYRDRRIFRTADKNFVGICHDTIARGDVVALVAGASTPFVFRRVGGGAGSNKQRFRLIGSAYVHGIMYGELMEGDSAVEFRDMVVV